MIRFALLIIILFLSGCNEKETIRETHFVYVEIEQDGACTYSSCGEDIIEPVEPPEEPIEETEPDAPIDIPDPVTLPEFGLNGLVQIDDGEFIVIQGGNISMSYDSGFEFMQDFELPSWTVNYKYRVYLDIIITNDVDELCIRSDFNVFGMAKSKCLYSDVRESVPLADTQAAYHGYRVKETKVSMTGVSGLSVTVIAITSER